jgi:hypothetical protein
MILPSFDEAGFLGEHVVSRRDKPKTVSLPLDDLGLAAAVLKEHFDADELADHGEWFAACTLGYP